MRRLGQGPIERDVRWLRVLLGKCGLAQPGGWLPFCPYATLPYNLTTAGLTVFSATVPRSAVIRTWIQSVYVSSSNDGSNYWTISLQTAYFTGIDQFSTSGISASSWVRFPRTNIDYAIGVSDLMLRVMAAKTGSPGGLYLSAPAVFVT